MTDKGEFFEKHKQKNIAGVSSITLSGHKKCQQDARELLAVDYDLASRCSNNQELLASISRTTVGILDRKVKHGSNLSFEEAFCGMCYVVAATNNQFRNEQAYRFEQAHNTPLEPKRILVMAAAFLNLMAAKESFYHLTYEEVAGMVSAVMMDTIINIKLPRVIETCGMGGDKGFVSGGVIKKGINASTLSSLVLSGLGLPSLKHGSYGNTSAIGSTEAIEMFGAVTSMGSVGEVMRIFQTSGYCFLDAHWCKTIHDLSHLLMMETVNHVVGPMTPPISSCTEINKLMGVNEKVHPETIAKAYALLHRLGKQRIGGVIVVAGLDESGGDINQLDFEAVKKHTILDEVSPYSSVVSLSAEGVYIGTYKLCPADFGIEIDVEKVKVINNQAAIQKANTAALVGTDSALADYLAMNASLGLYAFEYLRRPEAITKDGLNKSYLRECFCLCREAISSQKAGDALRKYVHASGGTLRLTMDC